MATIFELPQLSYVAPNFADIFVDSLRQYGFAAVVDHPLDSHRVERIYQDWLAFFTSEEVSAFTMDPQRQDGYFSLRSAEHAKGFRVRDFKEYFQFYRWGRCPDTLRPDLESHFNSTLMLGATLLGYIAHSLPTSVSERLTEPLRDMIKGSQQTMLRVLHYPPIPEDQPVFRAAPHEDINLLTLLPAADGPGLELRLPGGEWVSVPHQPGQLIVNIGDMLQEATGGYLPSTTHRVATPDASHHSASRMSLPLFLHPRPDVVLSDRYSAEQYLRQRLHELGVA